MNTKRKKKNTYGGQIEKQAASTKIKLILPILQ